MARLTRIATSPKAASAGAQRSIRPSRHHGDRPTAPERVPESGVCGAHYILSNANGYSCSGYLGGDCTNGKRIRHDRVEQAILDPIRQELLRRIRRLAQESTAADHITRQCGDQPLAWSRIGWQPLCKSHHASKTRDEMLGRAVTIKGCDVNGMPS